LERPGLRRVLVAAPPRGSMTILAGAPGTGKTLVALQYLLEGAKRGEKGLFVGPRESTRQLVEKARAFNLELDDALERGAITILRRVPIEFATDEVLWQAWTELEQTGSARLVIDSAGELERGIADDSRRHDIFVALAEFVRVRGATAVLTREMGQVVGPELDFADSPLQVLAENVILLRYVEFHGELARILSVLKVRDGLHDHSIRQYEIEERGFRVLPPFETAEGLLTGIARLPSERRVKRSEQVREPPEET
jgi:circadian clock protein KaiC